MANKGVYQVGPFIWYWGAEMHVLDDGEITVLKLYGLGLAFGRVRIPLRVSVIV